MRRRSVHADADRQGHPAAQEFIMTDVTRVRTQEQILDVVNLAREIWNEHYGSIIGQEQVDYMLDKFQSATAIADQLAEGYEYYTVSGKGHLQGYMAIVPDENTGAALLSKIYAKRTGRGRGFGRAMLDFAVALCRERRLRTLWLTVNKNNHDTLAWYAHMGFNNVGSIIQDIGGGFVMDDYRMEKNIDQPCSSSGVLRPSGTDRRVSHDVGISRPGQDAFALLLALVLIAILGGAVLATQLMIQQRLHAVSHRTQRYQGGMAAEAAIQQVLAMNRFGDASITQAVVKVDFPNASRIALAWQPAPAANASAPKTWWIKATIMDDKDTDTRDYKVRRDSEFWRMERW